MHDAVNSFGFGVQTLLNSITLAREADGDVLWWLRGEGRRLEPSSQGPLPSAWPWCLATPKTILKIRPKKLKLQHSHYVASGGVDE